jgi:hypothetical protein
MEENVRINTSQPGMLGGKSFVQGAENSILVGSSDRLYNATQVSRA